MTERQARRVLIGRTGRKLLTVQQIKVLRALEEQPDGFVAQDHAYGLIESVDPAHVLRTQLCNLRKAMHDVGYDKKIETVRVVGVRKTVGYRLINV